MCHSRSHGQSRSAYVACLTVASRCYWCPASVAVVLCTKLTLQISLKVLGVKVKKDPSHPNTHSCTHVDNFLCFCWRSASHSLKKKSSHGSGLTCTWCTFIYFMLRVSPKAKVLAAQKFVTNHFDAIMRISLKNDFSL